MRLSLQIVCGLWNWRLFSSAEIQRAKAPRVCLCFVSGPYGMCQGGPYDYGNGDPNNPFGGPTPPPSFWQSMLRVMHGVMTFFGRISMLVDQNTQKVAAASGDMRKALHVCRGAVEMLEAELRDCACGPNTNSSEKTVTAQLNSPVEGSLMQQVVNMVRLDHMARALAKTFRSAVIDTIQSLPQHQQIVLCSAVKLFSHGKKDATLGELNAAYVDFCKATSMNSLTVPEFSSICRVLSDQALLNLGQSREDRLRRVTLKVDEGDVIFALQGIRFFRNCLQ